jgi:hypothetical protein
LTRRKMQWTTFQGVRKDTRLVDHQHLSNCVYFGILVMGATKDYVQPYIDEIEKRFENKILPYRPHPLYNWEISQLINRGWIYINDGGNVLIINQKKVIGEVLKSTHPLFST